MDLVTNNESTSSDVLILKDGPMNKLGAVSIQNISLNKIKLSKNSRLNISDDEIAGLMASIKAEGLLQPIGVTKSAGGGFEICYGNRRFLAVSKLGFPKIPAIILDTKLERDIDMKNLAENIQRRNISLTEAGRYMEMLIVAGLSTQEIAVRLGVAQNYVQSCMIAYSEVPKEFQDDLEMRTTNDRQRTIGKISIASARAIINAKKSHNLSAAEVKTLFKAAKSDERFAKESVKDYAAAFKKGKKDPLKDSVKYKSVECKFFISKQHQEELEKKYVDAGPFRTLNGLFVSILKGDIRHRIDVIK